jgi:hypothetical protein
MKCCWGQCEQAYVGFSKQNLIKERKEKTFRWFNMSALKSATNWWNATGSCLWNLERCKG